ncbi:MAG TPA: hypothetical protein VK359_05945 [Rubrobacteraceae bacterium]|nr:hypothetical protein [Rubrobacteraceae bacterium]
MMAGFNKWWLMPFGILMVSVLISAGIVLFEPAFLGGASAEVAQADVAGGKKKVAAGGEPRDCSGASANDYACYQERYQGLVQGSGVEAAFTELKSEYDKNEFIKAQCHQITHVIGRAATDVYGDIPNTYSKGDNFCWSGYYHGAMEATVAKIGPDKILKEADTICAPLGEGDQKHSFYHYNCVHGLGHGFMGVQNNKLFESLEVCDTMTDDWERESCYSGAFMENIMAKDNPSHPSKELRADEPLYPCTEVEKKYKPQCYLMQTSYALETLGNDFQKVFELCGTVESEFRPTCYQSLGRDASGITSSDVDRTNANCMLGEDYEARSNCVIGAAKDFISYYSRDTEAKELCDSFDADLRKVCLKTAEEYYVIFEEPRSSI